MMEPREQLLTTLKDRNPDLAAHLGVAFKLAHEPGGMNLKLAAHAVRELGAMLPDALGVARPRGVRGETRLRVLAGRWAGLPQAGSDQEPKGTAGLEETIEVDSVEMPGDLFRETQEALAELGETGSNYADLVRSMVRALDPLGDPSLQGQLEPGVRQWLDLQAWFVGRCHHRGDLQELEAERGEFQQRLDLYEQALQAMFARAIDTLPELSALARRSPAEHGVMDRVLALVKKAEHHRRFFALLDSPAWLVPLEQAKFFEAPPPPLPEGDLISFPQWPQSQYLARVAGAAPGDVSRLILRLGGTENNTVRDDFVQAALAMPSQKAASLLPVFAGWLKRPIYLRLPLLLGQLVEKLAREGQAAAAFKLLDALLGFGPPVQRPHRYAGEVMPFIDGHLFSMLLEKPTSAVAEHQPVAVLTMLSAKLARAIRLERGGEEEDYSWIWMVQLTGDEAKDGHVKEHLVSALMKQAIAIARRSAENLAQVLAVLQAHQFAVFTRMRMRVLAEVDASAELQAQELLDLGRFGNHRFRREYNVLLRAAWDKLSGSQQKTALGWIWDGPQDLQGFVQRETERRGQPPPAEEVERYRQRWQLGRLLPIDGLLDAETQQHCQTLREGVEPLSEEPAQVVTWVGPTSPLGVEDFEGRDPLEAVAILRSWKPSGDVMDHSREGLGRVLGTVVAAKPKEWSAVARAFTEGVDPTYVRNYIEALGGTAEKGVDFDWEALLDLCRWVVDKPRIPAGARSEDDDPDWGWTRRSVGNLLRRGLQKGLGLPFPHRHSVWHILARLLHDPSPTPEDGPVPLAGEGRDAFTLSLNSVRGEATHATIEYSLWCARNLKEAGRQPTSWFDEIPEVRTILEEKLDRSREPSNAVRAALATYLPNLFYLDRQWLERQLLPALFGDLGPAWQAYLLYAQLHGVTALLLVEYYGAAARALSTKVDLAESKGRNEVEQKLAEHIILLHAYLADKLGTDADLVERFFQHAPLALRSHALGFIGWHLEEAKGDVPESAIRRMLDVVEDRVKAGTRAAARSEELVDLGSLFGAERIPDEWLLRVIAEALALTGGRIQPQHLVAERLAKIAESRPAEALRLLKQIVEGGLGQWDIYSWSGPAEAILRIGLRDEATTAIATDVINGFTERGYGQFEGLMGTPAESRAQSS